MGSKCLKQVKVIVTWSVQPTEAFFYYCQYPVFGRCQGRWCWSEALSPGQRRLRSFLELLPVRENRYVQTEWSRPVIKLAQICMCLLLLRCCTEYGLTLELFFFLFLAVCWKEICAEAKGGSTGPNCVQANLGCCTDEQAATSTPTAHNCRCQP